MGFKYGMALGALLCGVAAGAGAQSRVTLSGEVDAGLQLYKAANGDKITRLQNGGFGASRLLIAGSEDMGNGLRANFMLEMGPAIDTGAASRFGLFNRASWVGLSSNAAGELRLGRQLTGTANLMCQVDLHWCASGFNGTGIMYNGDLAVVGRWISGSPGRGGNNNDGISVFSGGNGTAGSAESNRKNNSVQYTSPRIGGFQARLMYALGETGSHPLNGNGNHFDATLGYTSGNLFLAAGYAQVRPDPLWNAKGELATLGGTYAFGKLKVGAIYQYETASGPAARWTHASAWAVTAAYQAGAFEPYVKFGQHRTNGTGAYRIVDGTDTFVVNVGSLYNLSKRTALYADFVTDLRGSHGDPAIYKNDPRSFTVGLRHRF
ncbi:Outer membrane porin protein 32 precursor [Pigmentiphaga humi]|uniref:Outer membrane porin protein 32 n=1 Tax=Pigmentiphaga humi TaxID=2478468 RepID=A0A3P4AZZ2_9BURK|nr:porin [Pigmentiphaga humi]VCU69050.1 Outer membrane porin protein 32 precursor [Pigmentiphaga humi]